MLELRRLMALKDVVRQMGGSDWTVRDIDNRWQGRRFNKPQTFQEAEVETTQAYGD